ncbi:MAG: hypothetical protein E7375_02850 [Clostridiales bacterium]|nr:hypothetical protein [Clostridiales bacterium]
MKQEQVEVEVEELKKQISFLTKTIIPSLEENTQSLESLKEKTNGISALTDQLNDLKEKTNILPELSSSIDSLEAKTSIITELDARLDTLEQNSSSGGGGGLVWETVYDKNSPDPNLNLGYTSGLLPSTTAYIVEPVPDLSQYKVLKFFMDMQGKVITYYTNIEDPKSSFCSGIWINPYNNYWLFNFDIQVVYNSSNKKVLSVATFKRTTWRTDRYSLIDDMSSYTNVVHIKKIEGLKF